MGVAYANESQILAPTVIDLLVQASDIPDMFSLCFNPGGAGTCTSATTGASLPGRRVSSTAPSITLLLGVAEPGLCSTCLSGVVATGRCDLQVA